METRRALLSTVAGALLTSVTHAAASEGEQLAWALFLKPMCDKHIEGFASKSGEPYERLRLRYPEVVANYEAEMARNSPPQDAPIQGQALEQLQSGCEIALEFVLNDGQPPDPRLTTPAQTWKLFMSALRSGDKETLALCFHPGDRLKYMQPLRQMTPSELAAIADSFTTFDLTSISMEDYQQAVVRTSDGKSGLVLFVNSARGWRISQL